MDLLYGLQGMTAASDEDAVVEDEPAAGNLGGDLGMDPSKLPSPAELLKMLDGMSGLSDEDRESLRKDLLQNVENGNDYARLPPPSEPFTSQALILLGLLAVIALIFVFFGYKLYKSLVEREQKREMKRLQRQMKKKK